MAGEVAHGETVLDGGGVRKVRFRSFKFPGFPILCQQYERRAVNAILVLEKKENVG